MQASKIIAKYVPPYQLYVLMCLYGVLRTCKVPVKHSVFTYFRNQKIGSGITPMFDMDCSPDVGMASETIPSCSSVLTFTYNWLFAVIQHTKKLS
jgi:hypothetical protein